jgi:hypothetical protein
MEPTNHPVLYVAPARPRNCGWQISFVYLNLEIILPKLKIFRRFTYVGADDVTNTIPNPTKNRPACKFIVNYNSGLSAVKFNLLEFTMYMVTSDVTISRIVPAITITLPIPRATRRPKKSEVNPTKKQPEILPH